MREATSLSNYPQTQALLIAAILPTILQTRPGLDANFILLGTNLQLLDTELGYCRRKM